MESGHDERRGKTGVGISVTPSGFSPSSTETGKSAYFLSDLHLGAPYLPESREAERRVTAFLENIATDAAEVYLLGDILDYWYEYRYVVPRGFVRFFGQLARMTDAGIRITWLIGNHDIWINDYIPEELGVEVIDGVLDREIQGQKCRMAHGDGVGRTDLSFRLLRGLFRNRLAQKLYSGIHPRWTIPFAYAWSGKSRKQGETAKPELQRQGGGYDPGPFIRTLADYSRTVMQSDPGIHHFIYGHLHVVAQEKIGKTADMTILGEWIRTFSFARMKNGELTMHRWNVDRIEDLPVTKAGSSMTQ